MGEILSLIRSVRRRTYLNLAIAHVFNAGVFVAAALAAAVLAAKLVFLPGAMDALAWAALAGLALIVVYALAAARVRRLSAAIAADDRLHLAERLSTALVVAGDASPFAQVVLEDAREKARAVRAAERFPIALPRRWWNLAVALLVLAAVLSMPQLDLLGRKAEFARKEKDRAEAAREVQRLRKEMAQFKKTVSPADAETLDILNQMDVTLEGIEDQRLGKKEALAALSSPIEKLAERMKELAREFAEGARPLNAGLAKPEQQKMLGDAKALLDKMDDLLKASELSAQEKAELAKALERAAANQELLSSSLGELSKMEDALKSGDLTEEQARQLAEALEKLAESLQQQGGNNPELAKELQKLAQAARSGDPKRMASAMRQAQQMLNTSLRGLNSQLAGLAGSMAANGMADSTLSDFAQSQMAADGGIADIQSMVDAMKGLGEFKSALTGSEAMSLSQALSTLQAAAATGSGGRGLGMRGPGTGEGNTWEVGVDTGDQPLKEKLPGQVQPGRTLVSFYTAGGNIKNESRVELQTVLTASQQAAKQALTDQKVPRAYEKVVKGYFENLEVQQ